MKNNVWVGYFEDVAQHGEYEPGYPSSMPATFCYPIRTRIGARMRANSSNGLRPRLNGRSMLFMALRLRPNKAMAKRSAAIFRTNAATVTHRGCCSGSALLCSYGRRRLSRAGVSLLQLGDLLSGHAGGRTRPVWRSMVVYRSFSDGPRRLMDGFWAVPDWAPGDESHLLGSSSLVTRIAYGKGSVTYSTFDLLLPMFCV